MHILKHWDHNHSNLLFGLWVLQTSFSDPKTCSETIAIISQETIVLIPEWSDASLFRTSKNTEIITNSVNSCTFVWIERGSVLQSAPKKTIIFIAVWSDESIFRIFQKYWDYKFPCLSLRFQTLQRRFSDPTKWQRYVSHIPTFWDDNLSRTLLCFQIATDNILQTTTRNNQHVTIFWSWIIICDHFQQGSFVNKYSYNVETICILVSLLCKHHQCLYDNSWSKHTNISLYILIAGKKFYSGYVISFLSCWI